MTALTLGAVGSVPSHGAEALVARTGGGFDVDAFAMSPAILIAGALIFELATVSTVQRIAAAPTGDGPSVPVAILRVLRP